MSPNSEKHSPNRLWEGLGHASSPGNGSFPLFEGLAAFQRRLWASSAIVYPWAWAKSFSLRERLWRSVAYRRIQTLKQQSGSPWRVLFSFVLILGIWITGFAGGWFYAQPVKAEALPPIAITVVTFTPAPSLTPIPTLTPTPYVWEILPDDLSARASTMGIPPSRWRRSVEVYGALRYLLAPDAIQNGRIRDEHLIALLIYSEFGIYGSRSIFSEALGALHNQYWSETFCQGVCQSIADQLLWTSTMQGFYGGDVINLAANYRVWLTEAREVLKPDGVYAGRSGWVWGNFDYWGKDTSPMGDYYYGRVLEAGWWGDSGKPYLALDAKWNPPFVVLTLAQAQACWKVDCLGLEKPK